MEVICIIKKTFAMEKSKGITREITLFSINFCRKKRACGAPFSFVFCLGAPAARHFLSFFLWGAPAARHFLSFSLWGAPAAHHFLSFPLWCVPQILLRINRVLLILYRSCKCSCTFGRLGAGGWGLAPDRPKKVTTLRVGIWKFFAPEKSDYRESQPPATSNPHPHP